MNSAMGRLVSLAAVAVLVGEQAGFASAAPTCSRVTSQWAVVFPAECTVWFQQGTLGSPPDSCSQVIFLLSGRPCRGLWAMKGTQVPPVVL